MGLFNNIKFPYFTSQQLNLDWLLDKVKHILDFIPDDSGDRGDVLTRTDSGADWKTIGEVFGDTNWDTQQGSSIHFRNKSGYVTLLFDGSTATQFRGSADWEVVGLLAPAVRPSMNVFFPLGAGGHQNDIKGAGYVAPDGSIGIYFPEACTNIGGSVTYPL